MGESLVAIFATVSGLESLFTFACQLGVVLNYLHKSQVALGAKRRARMIFALAGGPGGGARCASRIANPHASGPMHRG